MENVKVLGFGHEEVSKNNCDPQSLFEITISYPMDICLYILYSLNLDTINNFIYEARYIAFRA